MVQTKLLTQYILNLGKYDQSYDIRDRTRFIRQLIVPNEKSGALNKYARRILLAPKPAPVLESTFKGISYIFNVNLLSIFSNISISKWVHSLRLDPLLLSGSFMWWFYYSGASDSPKGSQVGPLYLGLMIWVNSWANANFFSDTQRGRKSPSFRRLFSLLPLTFAKGTDIC